MTYWQFRRRLYQQVLKQWLESLTQVSSGIVALFPMAFYALLLLPLLALGELADKDSSGESFFFTFWGYLLLAYCWIAMQKDAINATEYRIYDATLPVSARQRGVTELGLLLYAANVFIIGPAAILAVMVFSHVEELLSVALTESFSQLYPVCALLLLTFYYCRSALGNHRPWVSLGLLPLLAMPWANEMQSPWFCIVGVAIAILLERVVRFPSVSVSGLPQGFWRLYLQQDLTYTKPTLLRAVVVLLVLIISATFIRQIDISARAPVSLFAAFVLAIITATKLLELQSLQRRYEYYLQSLPLKGRDINAQAVIYCAVYSLPVMLLMLQFALLSMSQWGLFVTIYAVTQVGILWRPGYYLLFPLLTSMVILGGIFLV